MGVMASQITSLTNVYSTVCSGAYQRKYESSASLAFVRGLHRGPVNSPHKWPVIRKMFPFDDVIMLLSTQHRGWLQQYRYWSVSKVLCSCPKSFWNCTTPRTTNRLVHSAYINDATTIIIMVLILWISDILRIYVLRFWCCSSFVVFVIIVE